jgi:hypothetical protein
MAFAETESPSSRFCVPYYRAQLLRLRIFRTFGLGFANRNLGLLTLRRGGGSSLVRTLLCPIPC